MSLTVNRIELFNYRNYESFSLDPVGMSCLLIGPNAIGKTNLIEAIQLTTAFHSFRNPKTNFLMKDINTPSSIKTLISDGDRKLEVELRVVEGKKYYYLNGKKKQAQSLRGILPSVLFCPDDLNFVKGSQSIRRNQLDVLGTQFSSNYYSVRKDYEKIIRQKNRYLKDEVSSGFLESINEVVSIIGAQLYVLRVRLIKELMPYLKDYYQELSGFKESISVSYIPSWLRYKEESSQYKYDSFISKEIAQHELISVLEKEGRKEHARHISLFGPHADKIEFFINGRNAGLFASQGQQRSLVLSFKLAEMALLRDRLNQSPVLLLDDVMSELDSERRKQLISLFSRETQTVISSTNEGYFDKEFLSQSNVVYLGGLNGVK